MLPHKKVSLGEDFYQLLPVSLWLGVLIKLLNLFTQKDFLMEVFVEVAIHLQLHSVQVVWGKNLILIFTDWGLVFRS